MLAFRGEHATNRTQPSSSNKDCASISLTTTCPACGALLPDGAPGGALCAACSGVASAQTRVMRAPVLEVIDKLGQGGMGTVYRARQVSLDRVVALKVLPEQAQQEEDSVSRFEREARVAASLNLHATASGYFRDIEYVPLDAAAGIVGQAPRLPAGTPALPASGALALQGSTPATATKDAPFINSLGMKFVPVPITGGPTDGKRVLFSVWETRVQDFAAFFTEVSSRDQSFRNPGFAQGPTHPVVNVNWDRAQEFCAWLTERERKAGRIGAQEAYRIPTDHEWSCAVGLGAQEDPAKRPSQNAGRIPDVYPWGAAWPSPPSAGNYSGEETVGHALSTSRKAMPGYRDAYVATAPVGSFAANALGIFDLGGNVWEWCDDTEPRPDATRIARGGSFGVADDRPKLLSSHRSFFDPNDRRFQAYRGFRPVLAPAEGAK